MNKLTQRKVMPTLEDLTVDPPLAKDLSSEEAANMLTQLTAVQQTLTAQVVSSKGSNTEDTEDRLLNIDEAAQRLSMTTDWLYRNWKNFVFARKISGQLRFSSQGIDRYIKRLFR
jgi:predicted DNA-binding transcriptional regulator AlpA